MSHWMRVWQTVDVESVKEHLLIIGDVTADCARCRALGIAYVDARTCPECGTPFRFMTARAAVGSSKTAGPVVKRIKDRRPDLVFIDYDDYQTIAGKKSARDIFGDL